ncbi:hypothetical protein OIU76_022126 [Salix suchowensis]|nr:hypothetical protein OIU76_022126 [Salix suchowensis]
MLMPQLLGPPSQKQAMEESSSSNGKVVTAIVVTAAITLAIAVIFFFIYLNFAKKREKNKIDPSFRREAMATGDEFKSRKVRKFNGQDLLYVKNLDRKPINTFSKVTLNPSYEEEGEEKRVDVIVERFKKYEPQEVLPLGAIILWNWSWESNRASFAKSRTYSISFRNGQSKTTPSTIPSKKENSTTTTTTIAASSDTNKTPNHNKEKLCTTT